MNQQIVKHGLYLLDRKHRGQRYKHPIATQNAFGFAFKQLKEVCPEEAEAALQMWKQCGPKLSLDKNRWMWEREDGTTYMTATECKAQP